MILETGIGPISLGYRKSKLLCDFGRKKVDREPSKKLAQQLDDYFSGKRIQLFLTPVPDAPPFTKKCWESCRKIPYGKTISYKELATMAGSPKAVRAAGQAMRNNPQTIITPCHRVISSSGKPHGYSGSTNPKGINLRRKQFLLDLEQSIMSP